ncbi:MAG TPA: hypothetical protein PK156_49600 [Polyangium sp.]|nr:hypothetical protein [Polyangium sp.]
MCLMERNMTDTANDESENDSDVIGKLMGYDKWPEEVAIAFDHARGVLSAKYLKDRKDGRGNFASVLAEFSALESEYLVRVGDIEENAQQVRRIIAEMIFEAAWYLDEPFETCQRYWNEVVQLGFYGVERKALITGVFVACCRQHGQTDLGLANLDPLIAELERLRAEPATTKLAAEYYDYTIESLQRARARLEAERA